MPVYHFTFHAYGSWLPYHPKGYIKRNKGWKPPDNAMANHYREGMQDAPTHFTPDIQRLALDTLLTSQEPQVLTLYGFASETTHLHIIAGWTDHRAAEAVSQQLKTSISRAWTKHFGKYKWLAKSAGLTPVRDHDHLYQLVCVYLPKHTGVCWQPERSNSNKR